ADEPTGALDSKNARSLMEKLSGLNRDEQATILMVTHDSNAASFCKRILFIQDGVIFHELRRGDESQQEFYGRILKVMAQLGGAAQMFSNLILRNSHRSRKENGLFFSSLVISIVAFYMILSISTQDVMLFLQKMESDAVDKLLLLIPAFYGMTLGILFFLIYFACKYQFERRRHEFGVYLMLGMRRSKLFGMLLAEDFLTSILAMLIGLPVAVVLSEIVSLVTAKLVGMGIIGHQFSLSWSAIEWTLAGFLAIKLTALLILSGRISRQEIGTLLSQPTNRPKKQMPSVIYGLAAICGSVMLAVAYYMAIQGIAWTKVSMMGLTLLLGIVGTMLLFYGMRALIALIVKKGKGNKQLHVFTFRQIQENVIHQSTSMAISSLLILAALCCFGAGVGIAGTNSLSSGHVIDYTFEDHTAEDSSQVLPNIKAALKENGLENQFSELFEMRVGRIRTTEDYDNAYSMDAVMDSLRSLPQSEDRDVLLNNLGYATYPYLICLSDYNRLLELSGKPALQLGEKEAAVYIDTEFTTVSRTAMLNQVLAGQPKVELDGSPIHLTGEVQSVNLVTDRSITLSFALILPDEAFLYYSQGMYDTYVNAVLSEQALDGNSLMTAYLDLNEKLDETGIEYESYLQNIGRQLFYTIASSYITLYLAIVFLVVANTIVGVQFLMSQQKTGRRYQTLIRLGATYETLCQSAGKQITWFMGLPVLVAAVSSLFGVRALFTGILSSRTRGTVSEMLLVSAAMILLLCVIEYIYMRVVKRSSDRYLLTPMQPQREE
ncbi:MAG: FtsX-like permease family protein, partial [Blautia sp.]